MSCSNVNGQLTARRFSGPGGSTASGTGLTTASGVSHVLGTMVMKNGVFARDPAFLLWPGQELLQYYDVAVEKEKKRRETQRLQSEFAVAARKALCACSSDTHQRLKGHPAYDAETWTALDKPQC